MGVYLSTMQMRFYEKVDINVLSKTCQTMKQLFYLGRLDSAPSTVNLLEEEEDARNSNDQSDREGEDLEDGSLSIEPLVSLDTIN